MTSNLKLATEIELSQLNDLDQYIKDLSQFLKEYNWLFNIHVIDFFTDNSWNKIPESWREIENVIDLMGLIEMASSNEINENYPPELKVFLKRAKNLCLQNIYFEESCLDKINERAGTMTHRLTARMRPKKVHEVAIMSQYLSEFCKENEINTVVDLGSGQGYLSRITSLEHGLNVLAVDSNAHNTKVSQDIEARAYRSIRKLGNAGKILHTTLNIQQDNLNELQDVIDNFQKDCEAETHDWLLCGLHTCGNLAVNTLKMFLNSQAKGCVSVGCCYNFLEPTPYGQDFPISKVVYDEMLEFPKLAFRAACQTPFNWMADTELTSDFYRKHFYRALIHKVMTDKQFLKPEDPFPVMGRLLKPAFENFATYANTCLKQTKNPAVDSEELLQLEKDNAHGKFRIAFMWTLQGILAPVFESLILVDRLKYLHESNVRATIVPLFDLAKSPRCFGIVGVKN